MRAFVARREEERARAAEAVRVFAEADCETLLSAGLARLEGASCSLQRAGRLLARVPDAARGVRQAQFLRAARSLETLVRELPAPDCASWVARLAGLGVRLDGVEAALRHVPPQLLLLDRHRNAARNVVKMAERLE